MDLPLPFFVSCGILFALAWVAWENRWRGWGIPMGVVLATTAAWYQGDALYNDYASYRAEIGDESLVAAWWQVVLFLVAFGVGVPSLHSWVNRRFLRRRGYAMAYIEKQHFRYPVVQRRLDALATILFLAWAMLTVIALVRVKGDVLGLFAPYLGKKLNPWGRGQIGGGFSAFISLASYFQLFLVASIGVIAALARNPQTRGLALLICFLAIPSYILDRTRNTMLAVLMPGLLAYVLMRLRLGWGGKLAVLGGAFLLLNSWMKVVANTREGMQFDVATATAKFTESDEEGGHAGLNMFEELAWIESLMKSGKFQPETGQRYFAELMNPVPRAIWKNKPTIGLDYSVARGQAVVGGKGEVTATISTGMIGQGVVNFGPFFGPIAAALLMGLWVVVLARQDLLGNDPGRMILYGCGLILTFNLGRDITLLTLYPFIFGLMAFKGWQYLQGGQKVASAGGGRRLRSPSSPQSSASGPVVGSGGRDRSSQDPPSP